MNKYIYSIIFCAAIVMGCSKSQGDDSPRDQARREQDKPVWTPEEHEQAILKMQKEQKENEIKQKGFQNLPIDKQAEIESSLDEQLKKDKEELEQAYIKKKNQAIEAADKQARREEMIKRLPEGAVIEVDLGNDWYIFRLQTLIKTSVNGVEVEKNLNKRFMYKCTKTKITNQSVTGHGPTSVVYMYSETITELRED